jgi:hypothetical protein
LFEREHHRDVALLLQSLEPEVLSRRHCYFGGGTAMALRYGEYRESVEIGFLISDLTGYRDLRQMLGGENGLDALLRPGMKVELAQAVRADQYGIRTFVRSGNAVIKFEIVLEARIELDTPGADDQVCGVQTLSPLDLAAEKLLANADRWRDDSVFSRDVVDLALLEADSRLLRAACAKAEGAYGASVRQFLAAAIKALRERPQRLDECMKALSITSLSKAEVWSRIRRLQRILPEPQVPPSDRRGPSSPEVSH